jgi:hypothetical protein
MTLMITSWLFSWKYQKVSEISLRLDRCDEISNFPQICRYLKQVSNFGDAKCSVRLISIQGTGCVWKFSLDLT